MSPTANHVLFLYNIRGIILLSVPWPRPALALTSLLFGSKPHDHCHPFTLIRRQDEGSGFTNRGQNSCLFLHLLVFLNSLLPCLYSKTVLYCYTDMSTITYQTGSYYLYLTGNRASEWCIFNNKFSNNLKTLNGFIASIKIQILYSDLIIIHWMGKAAAKCGGTMNHSVNLYRGGILSRIINAKLGKNKGRV